jgi:hypothetical protein
MGTKCIWLLLAPSDVSLRCKAMSGLGATADIARVQRVAMSETMQISPHRHLGLRVLAAYRGHHAAALLWCHSVS